MIVRFIIFLHCYAHRIFVLNVLRVTSFIACGISSIYVIDLTLNKYKSCEVWSVWWQTFCNLMRNEIETNCTYEIFCRASDIFACSMYHPIDCFEWINSCCFSFKNERNIECDALKSKHSLGLYAHFNILITHTLNGMNRVVNEC